MIENGANIQTQDDHGSTALLVASECGYEEAAILLIKEGADIHCVDADGDSAILVAASNGHKKIAIALASKGADLNATNKKGETVLVCAEKHGFKEDLLRAAPSQGEENFFCELIGAVGEVLTYAANKWHRLPDLIRKCGKEKIDRAFEDVGHEMTMDHNNHH